MKVQTNIETINAIKAVVAQQDKGNNIRIFMAGIG